MVCLVLLIRYRKGYLFISFIVFIYVYMYELLLCGSLLKRVYLVCTSCCVRKKAKHYQQLGELLFNNSIVTKYQIHGNIPKEIVIFAVNYPNEFMEYIYPTIFEQQGVCISIVARKLSDFGFMNRTLCGIYLDPKYNQISVPLKKNSYKECLKQISQHTLRKKRSIWVYPERDGCRKQKYSSPPLRSGIFKIAEHLNLPVVPLVCSHLSSATGIIHFYIGPTLRGSAKDMKLLTKQYICQKLAYCKKNNL